MKTTFGSFIFFITLAFNSWAGTYGDGYIPVDYRIDSILYYYWDETNQDWESPDPQYNPEKNLHFYENGQIAEILIVDRNTNENIRRFLYTYNSFGEITEEIFQDWVNGEWVNNRKNTWEFNNLQVVTMYLRQNWIEGEWINHSMRTDYVYDNSLRETSHLEKSWENEQWTDEFYEYRTYDNLDRTVERKGILLDGTPKYRYMYSYAYEDNLKEFIHQVWYNDAWKNNVRRITEMDNCGKSLVQIRMHWRGDHWENYLKRTFHRSLEYYTYSRRARVDICHNGHTIRIPLSALPNHLAHGDCMGECLVTRKCECDDERYDSNGRDDHMKKEDLVPEYVHCYPNPFSTKTTITLPNNEHSGIEVMVYNAYGQVVKSWKYNFGTSFTLNRGNLGAGLYYVKIYGKKTYYTKFIIR